MKIKIELRCCLTKIPEQVLSLINKIGGCIHQCTEEVHQWIDRWVIENQHSRLGDLGNALRDLRELSRTQLLLYVTKVTPNLQTFCRNWTGNPNHALCRCLYTSLCERLGVVAG